MPLEIDFIIIMLDGKMDIYWMSKTGKRPPEKREKTQIGIIMGCQFVDRRTTPLHEENGRNRCGTPNLRQNADFTAYFWRFVVNLALLRGTHHSRIIGEPKLDSQCHFPVFQRCSQPDRSNLENCFETAVVKTKLFFHEKTGKTVRGSLAPRN